MGAYTTTTMVVFLIHKMTALMGMMKHKTSIYQKIKPTLSGMESKGFPTCNKEVTGFARMLCNY